MPKVIINNSNRSIGWGRFTAAPGRTPIPDWVNIPDESITSYPFLKLVQEGGDGQAKKPAQPPKVFAQPIDDDFSDLMPIAQGPEVVSRELPQEELLTVPIERQEDIEPPAANWTAEELSGQKYHELLRLIREAGMQIDQKRKKKVQLIEMLVGTPKA